MPTKEARMESAWSGSQARDTIVVGGVAALDSSQAPGGDALVGELNGEIVALITIRDGVVVTNPFRATAAVVEQLRRRRRARLVAQT